MTANRGVCAPKLLFLLDLRSSAGTATLAMAKERDDAGFARASHFGEPVRVGEAGSPHSSLVSGRQGRTELLSSWPAAHFGGSMPGISIHVVDISRGVVASGMRVELFALSGGSSARLIAAGSISKTGALTDPALEQRFEPGFYDARFHIADYYRASIGAAASVPFLDVVSYRFGLAEPESHYHLPMKCTPWGYSCFRGGA
jgi:5-hydroxyisourate hydrolase